MLLAPQRRLCFACICFFRIAPKVMDDLWWIWKECASGR